MSMALKEGNFDVVHAHYGTAGWVGRLQRSAPLVVTFHGSDLMGGRRTGRGWRSIRGYVEMALALLLARIVRDVIVVSPTLLARTPGGRASVITPGVDLTRFFPTERTEARQSLGVEVKQRMVLFVANPALANKRYALAHDAVQIARRSLPELQLVTVAGRPHAELPLWLNAADAVLLTSKNEGSPMVVKEALACNRPVVSVDVGDVAERIRGVGGCRLVEGTPDAIAAGLLEVLGESERCNGRELMTNLDSLVAAARVVEVYRRALQRVGSRRSTERGHGGKRLSLEGKLKG
jgi:glycosyltransferase involved in cell wall biosynthesis